MKLKRFAAALTAVFTVASLSVSVFAEKYSARLGFADADWTALDWETCTTVTGDGTYTIKSDLVAGADDFGVMIIEIEDMYAKAPKATAVLDKIEIDGEELEFDPSKIVYGNVGRDGNYVIEIFSAYGSTVADPGVEQATAINSSLRLTFTVSGLDSASAVTTVPKTELDVSVTTVPKTEVNVPEETVVPETTTVPKTETAIPESTAAVTETDKNVSETETSVPKTEAVTDREDNTPQAGSTAVKDDESEPVTEFTPEPDGSTEAADTGNMSAAVSAALMVCAGAVSVVSRKKKS